MGQDEGVILDHAQLQPWLTYNTQRDWTNVCRQPVIDNTAILTLICWVNGLRSSGSGYKKSLQGFRHQSSILRIIMRQSDLQFIPAVFDRVEVRALCKRAELSHTEIRETAVSPLRSEMFFISAERPSFTVSDDGCARPDTMRLFTWPRLKV